jgi:hypothetical protein
MLDGGQSLAQTASFQDARRRCTDGNLAWSFVDVGAIRNAGMAKELFRGPVDNPLAELLLGGIFANLQRTPFAMASLTATSQQLRLTLAAPHDRTWAGESREFYFGPEGKGTAPPPLNVQRGLLSFRTYRDIAGMWLCAGDLFNDKINDNLAKADSQLTTLFSGKDFGEDILGAFHPDWYLVVANQDFQNAKIQPAIKLPAFAFVFRLRDPAVMQAEMRRTFQSLVGFLNVVGAMNGQPQLELDMEKEGERQVVSSTYLPETGQTDSGQAKLHFNFSPTVAFRGDRFVISSSKPLAYELIDSTPNESPNGGSPTSILNTEVSLGFEPLREILAINRNQLVSQNMLEKGHSKEEAEREIGILLMLLDLVRSQTIKLETDDTSLRLVVELSLTG